MNDYDRVSTWYRVVTTTPRGNDQDTIVWRNIHRVTQHMIPELLRITTAAEDYINDPTSIERLHNLRQAIRRAQEDTR